MSKTRRTALVACLLLPLVLLLGVACTSMAEAPGAAKTPAKEHMERPKLDISTMTHVKVSYNYWDGETAKIAQKDPLYLNQHKIMFYGASNFRLWTEMQEDLAPYKVLNHAFGGSTDELQLQYADLLVYPYNPDIIVFQTGSNDFVAETETGTTEEALATIIASKKTYFETMHTALPDAKLIIVGGLLLPSRAEFTLATIALNEYLQAMCDEHDFMYFINPEDLTYDGQDYEMSYFVEDGIHLTHEARLLWYEHYIKPVLDRVVEENTLYHLVEGNYTGLATVETAYGSVSGTLGKTREVTVFKGIPYAKAPTGDLRWAEPQDPEHWEGVLHCTEYAPAAMQPAYAKDVMAVGSEFYPDGLPEQSEDCLYLNITTPAYSSNDKLPVMVYFHGGNLNHGYSYQIPFDAEDLAAEGVVVVTVGHRLNLFGFLSLPQLSATSSYGGSGNYGIMDCIKSVEWVYENIEAFGGDPENLTLFGQSGGSRKTAATVAAPQMKGKTSQVILQSSFPLLEELRTQEEAEEAGLALLDKMGIRRDATLEELRAIPGEEFARYTTIANLNAGVGINLDGKYIVQNLKDFYLGEGNLVGIHMMAGWVYGENGTFLGRTTDKLFDAIGKSYSSELVASYALQDTLGIDDSNVEYYRAFLKESEALDEIRLYSQLKEQRNSDSNMYIYAFGRVTPNKTSGWHSGELYYVFGGLDDRENLPDWEPEDYQVLNTTASYWANFAKTGNPNESGLPYWPAAMGDEQAFHFIDVECKTYTGLNSFDHMVIDQIKASLGE